MKQGARSYNRTQWREGGYVIDFKVGQSFGEPHVAGALKHIVLGNSIRMLP
jgi:hypothetical protein